MSWQDERGQTFAEYGLTLVVLTLAVAATAGVLDIDDRIGAFFTAVMDLIDGVL